MEVASPTSKESPACEMTSSKNPAIIKRSANEVSIPISKVELIIYREDGWIIDISES